jgi:two-component system chemotaxis response regulator CheB
MVCELNVKVAQTPEPLLGGTVYIGDSGKHIVVEKHGNALYLDSKEGRRINGVIPAADVLFNSIAENIRENALGIILTGMGNDGAKGLLAMKKMGAKTIGQNEETSVIYGMPLAAKNIGAVDCELPLNKIHERMISFAEY